MSYKIFDPRNVPEQSFEVPFIGDVFDVNGGEFAEVIEKELSVVSLDVTNGNLKATVAFQSLSLSNVSPEYTHIVVGVTATVPEDGILRGTSTATWTLQHPLSNVFRVANGANVKPGNATVVEYELMPIKDLDFLAFELGAMTLEDQRLVNTILDRVGEVSAIIGQLGIPDELLLNEDRDTIVSAKRFCSDLTSYVRSACISQVKEIGAGSWVYITVVLLKENASVETKVDSAIQSLSNFKKKYNDFIQLMCKFEERGVEVILSDDDFKRVSGEHDELCCLMIFTDNIDQKMCVNFFEFKRKCSTAGADLTYCVVDLKRVNQKSLPGPEIKLSVIRIFEDGQCVADDVMRKIRETRKNVATCNGTRNKDIPPKNRATLEIACPGHYTGGCPPNKRKWICQSCMATLYYGFDDQLYCICGGAFVNQFEFQCSDEGHYGPMPTGHQWKSQLKDLVALKEVNILILGQSGVGKSTWINSTSNYMAFKSLDAAEKSLKDSELLVPIPVRFTISDDNMDPQEVRIGDDKDEIQVAGASATQACKTYSIQFQNYNVNFIDTPGLGDTRGVDEDRKNLKKVLDYIRYVDLIHGICILLKPNETRISVLLSYCVKELLSNLHQSCSNNLVFCFTNSRETFYKPGETMPILKNLLRDMGLNFVMPERTFCLDNEAFKYLCCKSVRGITFSNNEQESNTISWARSVTETERLLHKVVKLEPHRTEDTMSLNRARRIILSLTRPVADITQNIERNIETVRNQKLTAGTATATVADLRRSLAVAQLEMVATPLSYPRTVCTADKCVKYVTLPQTNHKVTQYVQHCHEHCYLQNVQADNYPNRDLLGCWAMGGTQNCHQCSCSWETHMHIYYEQAVQETMTFDATIQQQINAQQNDATTKTNVLRLLEARLNDLEGEKFIILRACVKFAHFLRTNAIAAYNDVFGDYLDTLIQKEDLKRSKTPSEVAMLKKLQENKALFDEEKRIFEMAAQQGNCVVTADSIRDLEQDLYDLPINGGQLRQIMEVAVSTEGRAAQNTVHTVRTHQQPRNFGYGSQNTAVTVRPNQQQKNYGNSSQKSTSVWKVVTGFFNGNANSHNFNQSPKKGKKKNKPWN